MIHDDFATVVFWIMCLLIGAGVVWLLVEVIPG